MAEPLRLVPKQEPTTPFREPTLAQVLALMAVLKDEDRCRQEEQKAG